nr:hypothetical protein [Janibacter limosus]
MALVLAEGLEQRGDAGGRRDVAGQRDTTPFAELLGQLGGRRAAGLLLAGGDVDRRAPAEQALGDHPADAAGAAGHEGDACVQGRRGQGCPWWSFARWVFPRR